MSEIAGLNATVPGLEANNTRIQGVKRRSHGFRGRECFKMPICSHCVSVNAHGEVDHFEH